MRVKVIRVAAITILVSAGLGFASFGAPHSAGQGGSAAKGDLTGVWAGPQNSLTFSAVEPPMRATTKRAFDEVKPSYGPKAAPDSQDPVLICLPPGMPRILLMPFPIKIVQLPDEVIMLFEYDHFQRQIFLNRAEHPKDLKPTYMGDSIGHWENETLVVDTAGLSEKSWLDQIGHPHSGALRLTERIHRLDHDTLVDDLVFDDPNDYLQSWTGQQVFKLRPGWQLLEYVCEDHMDLPNR
jgi:hypothetical protein